MKICPIALAVGCARCPLVTVCPLKRVAGDYRPKEPAAPVARKPDPVPPRAAAGKTGASAVSPGAPPHPKQSGRRKKRTRRAPVR